jgi:3-phenylpropionate/trans-cinnamate dioxygenase ferredoxin reductase component
MTEVVVIGGGQAGASLVAKLRALNFEGGITLVCEEPVLPYQRPPLSKKYLLGEMEVERLFLRPQSFYDENRITVRTNATAIAIDRTDKAVIVSGEALPYDHLALTTGAVPRRLPGAVGGELGGVHVVRTLADVDAMAPDLRPGGRVLVIGGGYIGLEAAAVCAGLGLHVTLIEMADRVLQRVAASVTSDYFRALHLSKGVEIREGTGLLRLLGEDRVTGAVLSDGTELPVDAVIVGIGVTPATELAEVRALPSKMAFWSTHSAAPAIRRSGPRAIARPSRGAAGACAWRVCRTPSTRPKRWRRICWVRTPPTYRNPGSGRTSTM